MRKFIIIMSDAREEAAIAREALVRGKKKQKKQTTLMTKWNIVLDYGESGPHCPAPDLLHLHELLDAIGVASRFTTLA